MLIMFISPLDVLKIVFTHNALWPYGHRLLYMGICYMFKQ